MKHTCDFADKLLKEDLYDKTVYSYIEELEKVNNIIIWGLSSSNILYDFLKEHNFIGKVCYYADNNKSLWGTRKNGLLVLSPDEVLNEVSRLPNVKIIIACIHLSDVRKQLISLGCKSGILDIVGFTLTKDYYTYKNLSSFDIINSHFKEFQEVYTYLEDERSKEVYLGLLNSKISLNNKFLIGCASLPEEQYFDNEIIKLIEEEVFCDCGSFNGDTLEKFIALSGGRYKRYIAFEADKETFKELNSKIDVRNYKDVDTYNIACWNEKTELKFQSNQTAGHITGSGGISVNADSLDHIINENITFLKMDIEGAEEMALMGAKRLIQENNPVLAICIYHRLEDFYKLPLLIKRFNPEYKLYIRHYTDMVDAETVCYAIPKERSI